MGTNTSTANSQPANPAVHQAVSPDFRKYAKYIDSLGAKHVDIALFDVANLRGPQRESLLHIAMAKYATPGLTAAQLTFLHGVVADLIQKGVDPSTRNDEHKHAIHNIKQLVAVDTTSDIADHIFSGIENLLHAISFCRTPDHLVRS